MWKGGGWDDEGYTSFQVQPDTIRVELQNSIRVARDTDSVPVGEWTHFAFTWGTDDSNSIRPYLNAQPRTTATFNDTIGASERPLFFGKIDDSETANPAISTKWYNGKLEEVRISNIVRPAGWIETEYNNQNDQSGFWTVGREAVLTHGEGIFVGSPSNTLTDGLVGHWTFDGPDMEWGNTGQEVRDVSGNNNHGSLEGGMWTHSAAEGKIGQALSFDGVSDSIDVNTSSVGSLTSFTIVGWVNLGEDSVHQENGNNPLYAVLSNARSIIRPSGFYWGIWVDGSYYNRQGGSDTNIGTWTNWVFTRDGSDMSVYRNGVLMSSRDDLPVEGMTNISSGLIGRSGGYYMTGLIDEVRIYDRALTEEEIQELYRIGERKLAVGSPVYSLTDGLVGHWTFDGPDMEWSNTGQEVRDVSGNNNHGSLEGGMGINSVAIGQIGQALSFDGVSDYIYIESDPSLSLTGPFTLSAWIYPEALGEMYIVDGFSQYAFWIQLNNEIRLGDHSGNHVDTAPNVLKLNSWNHVVAVFFRFFRRPCNIGKRRYIC